MHGTAGTDNKVNAAVYRIRDLRRQDRFAVRVMYCTDGMVTGGWYDIRVAVLRVP